MQIIYFVLLAMASSFGIIIMIVASCVVLLNSIQGFDKEATCLRAPSFEENQDKLLWPEVCAQAAFLISLLFLVPSLLRTIKRDPPSDKGGIISFLLALLLGVLVSLVLALRNTSHAGVWQEPMWSFFELVGLGATPFLVNYDSQVLLHHPRRVLLTKIMALTTMAITMLLWLRFKLQTLFCPNLDAAGRQPWHSDAWYTLQTTITSSVRLFVSIKMATFAVRKFQHPTNDIFHSQFLPFGERDGPAEVDGVALCDLRQKAVGGSAGGNIVNGRQVCRNGSGSVSYSSSSHEDGDYNEGIDPDDAR